MSIKRTVLVVSRKSGQSILLKTAHGEIIHIKLTKKQSNLWSLGLNLPETVKVMRVQTTNQEDITKFLEGTDVVLTK